MKRFGLLFFAVLFGLILAESLARLVYTEPRYLRFLKEQGAGRQVIPFKKNSLGLRDADAGSRHSDAANAKRVLILGDSFTFGTGVANDEAIFPEMLERRLNAEFSGQGVSIEILNGGIPASLTGQWVDLLQQVKDRTKLDVVLIVFFLRDGTRAGLGASSFGPIIKEQSSKNRNNFFYQKSYFFRLYQDIQDRTYLSRKYARALNESYFGGPEQTREWETAKANILKIRAIAKEDGAGVGLVVFPVLIELNENYPFRKICNLITGFCADHDMPVHSVLPAFMGKGESALWVSPIDQHPNELAHRIAADSILPFLRQLLIDSTGLTRSPGEAKKG